MKKIVIEVDSPWQVFRAAYYALKHLRYTSRLETSVRENNGHEFKIVNKKTIHITATKINRDIVKPRFSYLYKGDFCKQKHHIKQD